jgi:hypothetical protein
MDMQFDSLSPEEAAASDAKVIITTKDEAKILQQKNVMLDTEFDKYPAITKAKILRGMAGTYADDMLTVGIDPGKRIGISIIYLQNEIESVVESSPEDAIEQISAVLAGISSGKKLVRIGDGDMTMATMMGNMIKSRFKDTVKVEIVDERGTSQPQNTEINRRGARDRSSARVIAFRTGRAFSNRLS